MTITDVAAHCKISWHQVRRIDKIELAKKFSKTPTADLEIACIDEISIKNIITI